MLTQHRRATRISRRTSVLCFVFGCLCTIGLQSADAADTGTTSSWKGGLKAFMGRLFPSDTSTSATETATLTSTEQMGLTFTAIEGGQNPSAQTLNITNIKRGQNGALDWKASKNVPWLTLSPTSGSVTTEANVLTIGVNTASLTANTYTGMVKLTISGATNAVRNIKVTLTVAPPAPTISKNPTELTFIGTEGGVNPAGQTLNITNAGKGTLNWTVSDDAAWLNLGTTSGTTTTETDKISVSVNTAGLTTNTYTATVSVKDSAASNSPQQIPVTLIVTAPESSGAVLNWDPNTESNMAGYKVYVGTASGVYGPAVNVGNVTTFKVINLSKGKTYYFAITAYDTSGNESAYSNEATKTIN